MHEYSHSILSNFCGYEVILIDTLYEKQFNIFFSDIIFLLGIVWKASKLKLDYIGNKINKRIPISLIIPCLFIEWIKFDGTKERLGLPGHIYIFFAISTVQLLD